MRKKNTKLTFFPNDRLNNVMDVMMDSFINSGSFVNDLSFLWDMVLINKKNYSSITIFFFQSKVPYHSVAVLVNLFFKYCTMIGIACAVNFFDVSNRLARLER